MCGSAIIPLTIIGLSLGLLLQYVLKVPEKVPLVDCFEFEDLCGLQIQPGKPAEIAVVSKQGETEQGNYEVVEFPFGRWTLPSTNLTLLRNHGTFADKMFRLKSWAYTSISTDKYHFAITPVQFNYVEDVYISVVEKATGNVLFEYHHQMPLGRSLSLASESTNGCSTFRGWGGEQDRWDICFDRTKNVWKLDFNLKGLQADMEISKGKEALILWYPLGGSRHRPAYVHKEAGMKARGTIQVNGGEKHSFQSGGATLDWTLSLALRETRWQWVSFSTHKCKVEQTTSDGKTSSTEEHVGINLSKFVYDVVSRKSNGGGVFSSAENAIWVNHRVFPLNMNAKIEMPKSTPTGGPWRISGKEGESHVNLTFEPAGLREDHTGADIIGIVSDFVQPFGSFKGEIKFKAGNTRYRISVDGAYGVCENHRAVW